MDFRNQWLSGLGQRLNIPGLAFDAEGLCQLSFDNKMMVVIFKLAEAEDVLLSGQLPVSHLSIDAMQQIMIEDSHQNKVPAPLILVSDSLDKIQLQYKLTRLELEAAEAIVEQLLDNLDYWHTRLNNI